MGTRADFYVGRGMQAEWLGSVAWDGYPEGFDADLFQNGPEHEWRERVVALLASREDGTNPNQGWPWPWLDSGTTDYAYAWDDGIIYGSRFGSAWFLPLEEDETPADSGQVVFPDMTAIQDVTMGSRSGVIVVSLGAKS